MRNWLVLWLCLLTLIAPASQGEEPADELTDLYSKLTAVSPKVVGAGYKVLHIEFDRVGKGAPFVLKSQFHKGYKYKVVGVGAKGISDISITLLDTKGKPVGRDHGVDGVGIVNVMATTSTSFTIKITAHKLAPGSSSRPYFFCLIASKAESREKAKP